MATALCPGMVLCRTRPGSYEVCIIRSPAQYPLEGAWTAVLGEIDAPPLCGLFELWPESVPRVWRRATAEEAAKVRALYLDHAKTCGRRCAGWIAKTIPPDENVGR